jgi:hypothetical protein
MGTHLFNRHTIWTVFFSLLVALGLGACSDVSNAPAPAAGPAALTITTDATLPNGTATILYTTTLAAAGGKQPYGWSIVQGAQPAPGLTMGSDGVISGTPTNTTTGVTRRYRVVDSSQPTQSFEKDLTIAINALPQPRISLPATLPSGVVGVAYSATLTASDGTEPYTTWSVTPDLPAGLTLTPSGSTASITGSLAAPYNVQHTFSVTDSFSPTSQTGAKSYFVTFTAAPIDLQISPPLTLPPGTVSQSYSHPLKADGGTGTLTWSLAGTSPNPLLPGLSLTPGGLLSGIPSSPRTNYTMKFRVQDSAIPADFDEETFTITTSLPAAPNITTTSSSLLPNGTFKLPYSRTLQASGGVPPFVWSFTGGSPFPNWLNLNPSTGEISGTPNATGTFNFNVQVTDNLNQPDPTPPSLSITIVAQNPPTITPFTLQNGTVNQTYPSIQLAATGGITPYINWTVTPALPSGLQFNVLGPGIISGTPLSASPATDYSFTVTDSTLPSGNTSPPIIRSLTVNAAVTINNPSPLPSGTVGQTYTAGSPLTTLTASGGTGSGYHNWLVTPALPTGLVLDNTTGAITGTPTTGAPAANYTFSVQDSSNNPGTKQLSLAVNAVLTINDPSPLLIVGTAGQTYTAGSPLTTLTASGGTGGYHNWLVTPALPAGLDLDNTTGAITGMATTATPAADYSFSVQDSSNQTVSKSLNLTIN